MDNISESFSANLKRVMESKSLSQKDLSELIGVSQQAISVWITGKYTPRMSTIEKICNALNVKPEDLLDESESANDMMMKSEFKKIKDLDLTADQLRRLSAYAEFLKNLENKDAES